MAAEARQLAVRVGETWPLFVARAIDAGDANTLLSLHAELMEKLRCGGWLTPPLTVPRLRLPVNFSPNGLSAFGWGEGAAGPRPPTRRDFAAPRRTPAPSGEHVAPRRSCQVRSRRAEIAGGIGDRLLINLAIGPRPRTTISSGRFLSFPKNGRP
jgi:hypothetical protein